MTDENPLALHYTGKLQHGSDDPLWQPDNTARIRAEVNKLLADLRLRSAHGALAGGGDQLLAEAALDAGAALHVVLPFAVERFIESSVAAAGDAAIARFRELLARAASLSIAPPLPPSAGDGAAYALAARMAMDAAMLSAPRHAQLALLSPDDGDARSYGSRADVRTWRDRGGISHEIPMTLAGAAESFASPRIRLLHPGLHDEAAALRCKGLGIAVEVHRTLHEANRGHTDIACFHAARLSEAMLADAAARLGQRSSGAFNDIHLLERARRLTRSAQVAADTLRRLGNDARHALRPLLPGEAVAAAAALRQMLGWYLRDFFEGPRLSAWEREQDHWSTLDAALESLAGPAQHIEQALPEGMDMARLLSTCPSLAAAAIERFIDARRFDSAAELLAIAERTDQPRNPRFPQLAGLLASRQGKLDHAYKLLRTLKPSKWDVETRGMLGGVCKRQWLRDQNRAKLEEALVYYKRAWQASERGNGYAGINVAACQHWLGQGEAAQKTARVVLQLLQRDQTLWKGLAEAERHWSFYDLATLAEAEWLVGHRGRARELSREAEALAEQQGVDSSMFRRHMALHR